MVRTYVLTHIDVSRVFVFYVWFLMYFICFLGLCGLYFVILHFIVDLTVSLIVIFNINGVFAFCIFLLLFCRAHTVMHGIHPIEK